MPKAEKVMTLRGMYRDVLRDTQGRVICDRGWHSNAIVTDCRRLLAGFMLGENTTLGIQGIRLGAGNPAWDQPPGTPPSTPAQTQLVDPNPHFVPSNDLQLNYLIPDTDSETANPTNRLQIFASLGPNVPPWPDANHPSSTLREFGLVGQLAGEEILINYVTHPAIPKDPASTLERTIWLVF